MYIYFFLPAVISWLTERSIDWLIKIVICVIKMWSELSNVQFCKMIWTFSYK